MATINHEQEALELLEKHTESDKSPPLNIMQELLELLAKNMFPEVFLQTLGLVLLGEVFIRYPDLNRKEIYSAIDVNNKAVNIDKCFISSYRAKTNAVVLSDLSSKADLDLLIKQLAQDITTIISSGVAKVIAGTLRILVTLEDQELRFNFIYAKEKTE